MLGTKHLVNLTTSEIINYTKYQTVRWRKPLWMGTAKSKKFKVPARPVIPKDEHSELMRLHNNYRTQINSLKKFLYSKHNIRYLASADPEEQRRGFEKDYEHCTEVNDDWNRKQQILREKYFADRLQEEITFAEKRIETELINAEKRFEEFEEIVRKEKANSKYFILEENLDEAIENALANQVDYNYALELNGDKFLGREHVFKEAKEEFSAKQ
nr:probable 28S ribosomal protein S26, mitochondrial [Leptinotarsa decemlineata]